jgi:hypothetical protein
MDDRMNDDRMIAWLIFSINHPVIDHWFIDSTERRFGTLSWGNVRHARLER